MIFGSSELKTFRLTSVRNHWNDRAAGQTVPLRATVDKGGINAVFASEMKVLD
jgi:hypothetical protein